MPKQQRQLPPVRHAWVKQPLPDGGERVGRVDSSVEMDGSLWTDGLSADNIGAVAIYDGSLICRGDASTQAGITGNVEGAGEFGAIYVRNDGSFEADQCDHSRDDIGAGFIEFDDYRETAGGRLGIRRNTGDRS